MDQRRGQAWITNIQGMSYNDLFSLINFLKKILTWFTFCYLPIAEREAERRQVSKGKKKNCFNTFEVNMMLLITQIAILNQLQ